MERFSIDLLAEAGDPSAQLSLAMEYYLGKNREVDLSLYRYWIDLAVSVGHVDAILTLASHCKERCEEIPRTLYASLLALSGTVPAAKRLVRHFRRQFLGQLL